MEVMTESTASRLLTALSTLVTQNTDLIRTQAEISRQLNKHTKYIIEHERAIARHQLCANFKPKTLESTTEVHHRSKRSDKSGR